jgi:hypothetical protein
MEWFLQRMESGGMGFAARISCVSVSAIVLVDLLSPCWGRRRYTSVCPDDDRCDAILRGRACVRQIATLAIQLTGYIAASSADPGIVEPVNDQGVPIREHETSLCFINPKVHVLFNARRSNAARRIYDDYFFVGQCR